MQYLSEVKHVRMLAECDMEDHKIFFFFYQLKISCLDKEGEDGQASEAELVSSISLINNMISRSMMVVGVFPFFFFGTTPHFFKQMKTISRCRPGHLYPSSIADFRSGAIRHPCV